MTNVRQPHQWRNTYQACQELFADYPLAAEVANHDGRIIQSMVIMLHEGGKDPQFFVLSRDSGEGGPSCSLCPWDVGDIVNIEADGTAAVPDVVMKAVTNGCPIPQDGSLFGWNDGGIITTLNSFCTNRTRTRLPRFTPMPLADLPKVRWPPYVGRSPFGRWFWDSYKAAKIVSLADLIARIPHTVYWVDIPILGSGCCAVARDVRGPGGLMLPRGRYVYHGALQARTPVPPLTALLDETGKIDLAPRFQTSM